MRLVKMKSLKAGPDGVFQPGQTIPVSEEEGQQLVNGGYAEWAFPIQKEAKLQVDEEEIVTEAPTVTLARRPIVRERKRKS